MATTYFDDAERSVAFPLNSRIDRDRAYRRALRHSRWVRLLRALLLAIIPVVLLAVVAANYIAPVGGFRLPAEIAKLVIKGTKITMQQPRLSGFTNNSRAYHFSAFSAAQDLLKPDLMELQQIRANMEMTDKSTVNLWADDGLYDIKAEMLTLHDNIRVVSSTGYQARLSEAVVNMHTGDVVSEHPVAVKLLDGDLHAQHLQIAENGDAIVFSGGVTLLLQGKDANQGR